jgi:hypothetical protein
VHIKDLDLCRYHTGPFDAGNWSVPLLAVGWLEHPEPFARGIAPTALLPKLKTIVEQVRSAYSHCGFRGVKRCSQCTAAGLKSPGPIWSQENIFVPGLGVVYVAPGGIIHYVEMHVYLPPPGFVESVLRCPDLHSKEYYDALCASNAGIEPPLKSAENFKKWISSFCDQASTRQDRPDR